MNIAEAQLIRQLLARVQALEFAVAELEHKTEVSDVRIDMLRPVEPEKRKPGRPRKQQ